MGLKQKPRIEVFFGGYDTGSWLFFSVNGKAVAAESLYLNREEMMALAQAMYNVASRPQHVSVEGGDIFEPMQAVEASLEIKVDGTFRRYRGLRSPAKPANLVEKD